MFALFVFALFLLLVGVLCHNGPTKLADLGTAFILFGGIFALVTGLLFFTFSLAKLQHPPPNQMTTLVEEPDVTVTLNGATGHQSHILVPNTTYAFRPERPVSGFLFEFQLMRETNDDISGNQAQIVFQILPTTGDPTKLVVTPGRDIGIYQNGKLVGAEAWSAERGTIKTKPYRYDLHALAFWFGRYENKCHGSERCMAFVLYADGKHRATIPVPAQYSDMRGKAYATSAVDVTVVSKFQLDPPQPLKKQPFPKINKLGVTLVPIGSMLVGFIAVYVAVTRFFKTDREECRKCK